MTEWLQKQLSECLNFPVPDEMIEYISNLKDSHEIDEYFATLLNFDLPDHKRFLNDYKQRLFSKLFLISLNVITNSKQHF